MREMWVHGACNRLKLAQMPSIDAFACDLVKGYLMRVDARNGCGPAHRRHGGDDRVSAVIVIPHRRIFIGSGTIDGDGFLVGHRNISTLGQVTTATVN